MDKKLKPKDLIEINGGKGRKAERVISVHKAQLLNYLRASSLEFGLIINFAKPKLRALKNQKNDLISH